MYWMLRPGPAPCNVEHCKHAAARGLLLSFLSFRGENQKLRRGCTHPQQNAKNTPTTFSRLRAKINSPRLEINSFPSSTQRSTNKGDCRPGIPALAACLGAVRRCASRATPRPPRRRGWLLGAAAGRVADPSASARDQGCGRRPWAHGRGVKCTGGTSGGPAALDPAYRAALRTRRPARLHPMARRAARFSFYPRVARARAVLLVAAGRSVVRHEWRTAGGRRFFSCLPTPRRRGRSAPKATSRARAHRR